MSLSNNFPAIAPSLNLDFANTKRLDPRITFTRTTTAVYYDGVTTAKAEENLLRYSQEFDNGAWINTFTTDTANTEVAPDGTTTADTITETVDNDVHRIGQGLSVLADNYVFSVFLKKGDGATAPDWIQLANTISGSPRYANFNLTTGAVGASSGATGSILSVGNGWYRCSIAFTGVAGTTGVNVVFTNNNDGLGGLPSYTGATTANVFVWGAQLEQRSALTDYTPTTTQAITNYIPVLQTAASGVARFDHNPTTGESLGLLVEEQRTNLLTYSAEFDNAAWTKNNSSITANTIVAPDGTLTGDLVVHDTTSGTHSVGNLFSKTAQTYTGSVFIKKQNYRYVDIAFSGVTNWDGTPQVKFDLDNGTYLLLGTSSTATITPVGNGWFRCTLTSTSLNTTSSSLTVGFNDDDTTRYPTFSGDDYSGGFVWGAQVEAGAFPTSYIATTSASVTRNADVASMTGTNFSSWYRADEGTLYAEAQYTSSGTPSSNQTTFIFSDSAVSNYFNARRSSSSGNTVADVFYSGSSQASLLYGTFTNALAFKVAIAVKVNDFAGCGNAGTVSTDTSGSMPLGITQLYIGAAGSNSQVLSGTIRKFAYYPSRLTNAQLQALTS